MTKPNERILVVRLSSGGDVLQTLPALAILREARPEARITFLVEDRFARFVLGRDEVDEVLVWPRSRWTSMWRSVRAPLALVECLAFWADLARKRFHVALDFQGNLKSGLHTAFTLAPRRIGFARESSKEGNFLFTNRKVVPSDEGGSRVRKYVELLAGLGVRGREAAPVGPPRGAAGAFRRLAGETGLPGEGFWVIHPGTSRFGSYKRWPLDRWKGFAERLAQGAPVLVSWGPGDEEAARSLGGLTGVVVPDRPIDLPELSGALTAARGFVGTDSAPLHLAHALGCPAVGLFGPTDPKLYRPWMTGRAVTGGLPCTPCPGRGCGELRCMEAIEVEAVLDAAEGIQRLRD
ncbi:MAG: glycosyltransferase family 9 protein [Planctomycetota bacterium]|jgi:ADP-heptose:LPS heptosyltransferase